jgi:3-oxoacyl-(acyl-carrier-protein) synthase/acyl carrier protein/NAD(P)-dependent dehydrogenase (short-subunit alcohol dehydrogenase family)
MVMGHSLGEYGALVAAGALSFEEALKAVSARGTEMTRCALDDNGLMAAVFGPVDQVEKVLATIDGYVVVANINSTKEAVIGGEAAAVEKAAGALREAGFVVRQLPVSHAFHTRIVAPASESLARVLRGMNLQLPSLPIISNVTGDFYPMGPNAPDQIVELLGKQVASPVQFVKGLNRLYDDGARVFVEVGPKRVLYGFVEDVLGERDGVFSLFTNHPRIGELASVNQALCGLYAAGLGVGAATVSAPSPVSTAIPAAPRPVLSPAAPVASPPAAADRYTQLGQLFAEFLDRGFQIYKGVRPAEAAVSPGVFITGAALGLPGVDRVFDDANVERMLRGDQFIDAIPMRLRRAMVEKNITRLVKTESGEGRFDTIDALEDVIKLAARARDYDLVRDFGFPEDRLAALDHVTRLAIGAGIDALRDAGIPLVMRYKTTTKGTTLPDRWMLPEALRDDTGIIFTSAFPGYDSFEEVISDFWRDRVRRERLEELAALRAKLAQNAGDGSTGEIDRRIAELRAEIQKNPYHFDRRFLFRVLSMGHSQFAEYIGARGPNTATNAACASGTQAVVLANDWIRTGRCRRVIVISADDITSDNLMGWFGSGFLASGAAATDEIVEEAATPFDRRRHGLLIGMGAAALVVESDESARERGISPICEVLASISANSAFHGSRLDVSHICRVMEALISDAERRWSLNRSEIAPETVFVSHETYTPARGGSASAEVFALRQVFREATDRIVVANTKGATGHPMAVGIEDVVAVKMLETGVVPPVPNFREVDPELGLLNLSRGGQYPIQYALRLGAGFGSQIAMTLCRWTPPPDGRRRRPGALGYAYRIADRGAWQGWLKRVTGYDSPEIEVAQRTLRVKNQGPAARIEGVAAATAPPPKPAAPSPVPALVPEPPAPVAPPPVAPPAPPARVQDPVQIQVLRIVSDKTGYPSDMLDMDLDLEADLGIDTVKQAEMFAAIRAAWDIPRDDNLKLRDFPTLAHAVKFVYDRRPDLKQAHASAAPSSAPAAAPPAVPLQSPAAPSDGVKGRVLAIVAEKTGYPPDMLDLDLDLEADLGIDTVKQAEMFAAIRGAWDIPRDDNLKLRDFPTLAHAIQFVYDRRPDLKPVSVAAAPAAAAAPATPAPATPGPEDEVRFRVLHIVADKTGYPPDMLDLDLDLEADLGIDTVKQAEMFAAIRAAWDIPRDDSLKLRDFPTLAHAIQFVYDRRPDLRPKAKEPQAAPPASGDRPAPPAPEPAEDPVRQRVLEIIAEKTGYPPDMLDMDLDLEADLGIDTVKQAEMFAAIRAAYDIPRDDSLKLRDFPTLAHTVQFVYDRKPGLRAKPAAPGKTEAPPAAAPEPESAGSMEAAERIPRRVPAVHLRPSLELCKKTGVVLDSSSRIVVMPDQGGVGKALAGRLEKLGATVLLLDPAQDVDAITRCIHDWKAGGAIQGVYWLPALDQEARPAAMSAPEWREAVRVRVKLLYAVMRELYDSVGRPGTFLVSATRLGGLQGYDAAGAVAPLGGGVTGFTKAFKREKLDALVKAVDFEQSRKTTTLADLLIEETLSDPGAVEVGSCAGHRWTVGLRDEPLPETPAAQLGRNTVFVVTGAAGSIVSAITADLAQASGGTFYLLDLTPEPDPQNPDLEKFRRDKDGLKRDIFERLKQRVERPTPAMVEKEMAALERSSAALAAIRAVERAGGTARYFSVNLLDAQGVSGIIGQISGRHGRIDILIHAAGIEISHLLPDKKPAEFDLVFDVKAEGWFNLLHAIGEMPLGAAVVFSSVAGRFGNVGQTDYSAANDFLCKSISSLRSASPQTRGVAIDWTAWAGIGMAARGSIPTVMKQAGIDMLPPEAGIPMVRRELTRGNAAEVVVAGRLGTMMEEFDPSGGLASEAGGPLERAVGSRGVMTGRVRSMGVFSGLTIETELDPAQQPFLHDHQIGGTPLLPGVMGIEALAEAARLLFPARVTSLIEDVRFLVPFKFYRGRPRTLELRAVFHVDDSTIVAECRLLGSRLLHGQEKPEITTHFTARIRLAEELPAEGGSLVVPAEGAARVTSEAIYRLYFHGPAYQVVESCWQNGQQLVGRFASDLPANHFPEGLPLLAAPRLIELCFQTAGLWELATKSKMGLPYSIDRLRVVCPADGGSSNLYSIVVPNADGSFDATVADAGGKIHIEMRGYRTMELPDPVDPELLEALRTALKP